MKFIVSILSVYILVLTSIPCIDRPVDHQSAQDHATANSGSQHQHEGEDCSPFCTCSCCGTLVIQQEFYFHFDYFTLLQEYNLPEYVSAVTSDYLESIWQPPQFC